MEFLHFWELFTKIILPFLLVYIGYIHKQMGTMMTEVQTIQKEHYQFQTQVASNYVTQMTLRELDTKISQSLNRIDDKLTRILEHNKDA